MAIERQYFSDETLLVLGLSYVTMDAV